MFPSRYLPCPDCGDSVERTNIIEHVCDDERRLDYQMFKLRDEVQAVEAQIGAYLSTRRGQFELWYAQRRREPASLARPSDTEAPARRPTRDEPKHGISHPPNTARAATDDRTKGDRG